MKIPEIDNPPLSSFERPRAPVDTEGQRRAVFSILAHVLIESKERFDNNDSDASRLKWGRLICSASLAYGKLLEDIELGEIMAEVEAMEHMVRR